MVTLTIKFESADDADRVMEAMEQAAETGEIEEGFDVHREDT
jgi:hypothetical protein